MEFIYIISIQRGQRARGISLITDNYENAIINYYNIESENSYFKKNEKDNYFSYELHKVPFNEKLDEEKLGLNSKFRIKFKTWKEVKDLYQVCNRESKISNVLNKLS